jgi:DNA-binding PadR family transcriptional regulator
MKMSFDEQRSWWVGGGRGRDRDPHGRGRHGFGGRGEGGRGWPWPDLFGDRPPRAERGGVRYLVLSAIADTPRHGYEIMAVIEKRSGGAYRPSPGVIYPTLQLLEELGHVKVTEREDKRVYSITAAGLRELEEHREDVESFYEQSEDVWIDHGEALREVMDRVRRLLRAFRRAARRGRLTPTRLQRVRGILDEAVNKLEALLDE